MIRFVLAIVVFAALVVGALALAGDPGAASLTWLGWRVDMTAAAASLLVLFGALVATVFWNLLAWAVDTPRRNARRRAEARRREGAEALTRGYLADAAGDGSEARRLAQKAVDMADDLPALARLLSAKAAETAGDLPAARAGYGAMLGFPDMRLAALKGLTDLELAAGDKAAALRRAQEAYDQAKTARWAWRALLEDRLANADWTAALGLIDDALARKIVSPIVAERARAALLAASAASLESEADPRGRAKALDFAQQAARQKPDFAPGVVMAARLLAADGKQARAAGLIENAWKAAPHPALWLAYRDLETDETPAERARRLQGLVNLNPGARESRILAVEQALVGRQPAQAALAAQALTTDDPTARLCGLLARVAFAGGQVDEGRAWMARAAAAPVEPDWSDLDPEGRAFAYTPADWARLVSTYAETGELIHPRLERGERTMSEAPDVPLAYEDSAPFVGAGGGPMTPPIPDAPDAFADALQPPVEEAARAAPRRARRRLAPGPRSAK